MSPGLVSSWWQRFKALPRTSVAKTLGLAFVVAVTSAVLVTGTRVLLEPREQANVEAARAASLLASLRSIPGFSDALAEADASELQLRLVDLQSGEFAAGNAEAFDPEAAAADPASSVAIPDELDLAQLGRRAKHAAVYLFGPAAGPDLLVLPVRGLGYQSIIRAFVILRSDLSTIAAFTVYEHGETAGIGSQVAEPEWQQGFRGKKLFAPDGSVALRIRSRGAMGVHHVDGITGATRSANGIANMFAYWLGPHGYGPFLTRLKAGQLR